jgi:hypothetical protein
MTASTNNDSLIVSNFNLNMKTEWNKTDLTTVIV